MTPSREFDSETLPRPAIIKKFTNMILFCHVTTTKSYSSHTRTFLSLFGVPDEDAIVAALKNPERAIEQASNKIEGAKADHASRGRTLRMVGMGLGAIAGGVLVGVTGGLAAPLVGAGVTTLLGWLGVGGTAAGLLASGLAGSSVICGTLFGVYGAKSMGEMVERHTREVRDLEMIPIGKQGGDETLAVRLCVSGWLSERADVTAPWTIFEGDDTFALQWVSRWDIHSEFYDDDLEKEVQALEELSSALSTLIKSNAMKYVRAEIIRRTVLSALMKSMAPIALLKIGQIIGLYPP